jgi:hypothetical protein
MSSSEAVVWRRWWKRIVRTSPTGKSLKWHLRQRRRVGISVPIADSEASAYGNEIYAFVQASGFGKFDINSVTRSAVAVGMIPYLALRTSTS